MFRQTPQFLDFRFSLRGFTLIELLITVAVLGILSALAGPSFVDLIRNNRVASIASEMAGAINIGRSEAVRRGTTVTICKSANPGASTPSCTTSGTWEQGWLVFVDKGTAGSYDTASDTLLRIGQPAAAGATISGAGNFANKFDFNSRGLPSDASSFSICLNGLKRTIEISNTGRLNLSSGTC